MSNFWKGNGKYFDFSKSHNFVPSDSLIQESVECSQTMSIMEDTKDVSEIGPLTKSMRDCKHNRLWKFTLCFPNNIIGYCERSYWRFI